MDKVLIQRIFYLCILCTDRTIWTQWHRILLLIPSSVYITKTRPNSTLVIAQGVVVSIMLLPVGQSRDKLGPDIKGYKTMTWSSSPGSHSHNNWIPWGGVEGRVILDSPKWGLLWHPLGSRSFLVVGLGFRVQVLLFFFFFFGQNFGSPQQPIVWWHMKIMYIKWCTCAFFFQCGTFFPFFFLFSNLIIWMLVFANITCMLTCMGSLPPTQWITQKSFILIGSLWVHTTFPILNLFIWWQLKCAKFDWAIATNSLFRMVMDTPTTYKLYRCVPLCAIDQLWE